MKTALAILAILGLCAFADADCRSVVRSRFVNVIAVEPVIAAVFQPIAVNVPSYSVGYSQSQSDPALIDEIRLLRQAVERMAPQRLATVQEPVHVGLLRANCASCHGAVPKGNKVSLFAPDGTAKEPSPELLGEMISRVSSGNMPKGGKMLDGDRLKLITGLPAAPEAASVPPMPPGK